MAITKSQLLTKVGLVLGIIILLNIVAANWFFRLDFTADQRYTLSSATKTILEQTDKPVTVKAYFSKDIPARIAKVKRYFKDLLVEYASASETEFVYNFVNPNKNKKKERKAQKKGIKPMLIGSRERDQVTRQRVYMGAEIKIGGKSEVISRIQPGGPVEYKLSSNIRKLASTQKPKIALLQGHGEAKKQELGKALNKLNVLYKVEPYTLTGKEPIPDKYRTALLLHPKDSLNRNELNQLDKFLTSGRNLFVATDRINAKLQQQRLGTQSTGLETWLKNKGVEVSTQSLLDAECGAVTVRRQAGGRAFRQRVKFPYFPIIKSFEKHAITTGVGQLFLPFASPLRLKDTANELSYELLATSSKTAGTQTLPSRVKANKQWTKQDLPKSNIPVAVAINGKFSKNAQSPARMVVVSADNLIPDDQNNSQGRNQANVRKGNANLVANSVDWLSDEMGLMALRTQGVEKRPVKDLEDGTQTTIKYANAVAPVLVFIIIGLIRYQQQQAKRRRWALS